MRKVSLMVTVLLIILLLFSFAFAAAPSAVTNLKATAGPYYVHLTWNRPANAEGYAIFRKVGNGNLQYVYVVTKESFTDMQARTSNYNFYWVKPYRTINGKKVYGSSGKYVYGVATVAPVSYIKAIPRYQRVDIEWNRVQEAHGYIIYRMIGKGKFSYLYMTSNLQYSDRSASSSQFNFYRVYPYCNVNGKKIIAPSTAYVYAKAHMNYDEAVTGLTTTPNVDYLNIRWNKVSTADGYFMYRGDSSNSLTFYKDLKGTSFNDYDFWGYESKYYRVYPYKIINGKKQQGRSTSVVTGKPYNDWDW